MRTTSPHRRMAAAVLALLLIGACRDVNSSSTGDMVIQTIEGDDSNLRDLLMGRTTVVSLWAVWCQPCRRELPALARLADERSDVAVLAIDIGDESSAVRKFLAEFGLYLPVVLDAEGSVLELLGVPAVPATFIFDDRGEILWEHLGAVDDSDVIEALDQIDRGRGSS